MIGRIENNIGLAAGRMELSTRPEIQQTPRAGPVRAVERSNPVSLGDLEGAVKEISESLELVQNKIALKFDKETDQGVMQIIDRETGKVIRQVPPEELLKIQEAFRDLVRGLLLDEAV